MATNQVINGKNRITEFPNRWNLTNVGGNNYDVEQVTGEITEVGTPYGKAILDKIDNILSYLTPSVEKVEAQVETPIAKTNVVSNTITPSFNNDSTISNIHSNYQSILNHSTTDIVPELNAYAKTGQIKTTNAYDSSYVYVFESAYNINGSSTAINNILNKDYDNYGRDDYGLRILNYSTDFYFDYDFKVAVNIEMKFMITARSTSGSVTKRVNFYTSNNGTDWTLATYKNTAFSETTISISNSRYLRIEFPSTDYNGWYLIHYIYFNVNGSLVVTELQNQLTLDNNTAFVNNQRVLVDTPSTLDLTGVESNTLNGIDIPTLLKPSTKYELVYNESANKFELGGLKTLFDITLTEAVNEVNLNGILNNLKQGILYSLIISNSTGLIFSSNGQLNFLGVQISSSLTFNRNVICTFINSNNHITGTLNTPYTSGSSNVYSATSFEGLATLETIASRNTSITFNTGTRIIIKEVA